MSDEIRTRPATQEYRDGWERTFGKPAKPPCLCGGRGTLMLDPQDVKSCDVVIDRWPNRVEVKCFCTDDRGSGPMHGFTDRDGVYHPAPGYNAILIGLTDG